MEKLRAPWEGSFNFAVSHPEGFIGPSLFERMIHDLDQYGAHIGTRALLNQVISYQQEVEKYHHARIEQVRKEVETDFMGRLASKQTEPIVSYRVWRYKDGWLQSAYKDSIWPGFKPFSRDLMEDVGIHGIKDYKQVPNLMKTYRSKASMFNPVDVGNSIMVAGSISMWGEVKEHEIGYLSEFAYPKELFVGPDFDPLNIMTLEENYGVPVTVREELNMKKEPMIENAYVKAVNRTYFTYAAPMPTVSPAAIANALNKMIY